MRQGIEKLAAIVQYQLHLDVFDEHAVFLFCGRQRNCFKTLVCDVDRFTLIYHRTSDSKGRFQWPLSDEEVLHMTPDQYRRLMNGFAMEHSITIKRKHSRGSRV